MIFYYFGVRNLMSVSSIHSSMYRENFHYAFCLNNTRMCIGLKNTQWRDMIHSYCVKHLEKQLKFRQKRKKRKKKTKFKIDHHSIVYFLFSVWHPFSARPLNYFIFFILAPYHFFFFLSKMHPWLMPSIDCKQHPFVLCATVNYS